MANPYDVVRQFEAALCEYSGAPYCVTTTSCTSALLLACAWHLRNRWVTDDGRTGTLEIEMPKVEIPRFTYVGVAQAILNAGGRPTFRNDPWSKWYQLKPLPIWDSARWVAEDMFTLRDSPMGYRELPIGAMVCLSFHHTKHLGISTHGGAILHDDPEADAWLRRARFDGRTEGVAPKDDRIQVPGWHCYMTPPTAAEGLLRLSTLPKYNEPLPWGPGTDSDYGDLSQMEAFK